MLPWCSPVNHSALSRLRPEFKLKNESLGGSTYSYSTFPRLFDMYIKATRSLKTSVAFFQWRTKMEKAIDIHNYENDFKTVMVKMHSSDFSAKNKNLIENFSR